MTVAEKLDKGGPRTLLALDGGGIRGIVTVEALAEIKRLLQRELGRGDDFVLADDFDYIGGTSTGAIIAACLALGMRVERIRRIYVDYGRSMFERARLLRRYDYRVAPPCARTPWASSACSSGMARSRPLTSGGWTWRTSRRAVSRR